MASEIQGRLKEKFEIRTGTGQNGQWQNQSFLLETEGTYPKKVCLQCAGKNVEVLKNIKEGELLNVKYEPESKLWNEKWYTQLNAFGITIIISTKV